jgi:hypothetical protein
MRNITYYITMGGSESKTSGDVKYKPKVTPQIGPSPTTRIYDESWHRNAEIHKKFIQTYYKK